MGPILPLFPSPLPPAVSVRPEERRIQVSVWPGFRSGNCETTINNIQATYYIQPKKIEKKTTLESLLFN